ncbi:hypothetical protein BCR42DRAFT_423397 [Absidia repens]|uniref:Uncharacterized protein n=1 Tax=Absidia repens TaxID=90262 RepID=A0A1X2I5Z3_9FUNG|nr:hypothetical protein BCR42DRAFT_423397 [Absidia repens]
MNIITNCIKGFHLNSRLSNHGHCRKSAFFGEYGVVQQKRKINLNCLQFFIYPIFSTFQKMIDPLGTNGGWVDRKGLLKVWLLMEQYSLFSSFCNIIRDSLAFNWLQFGNFVFSIIPHVKINKNKKSTHSIQCNKCSVVMVTMGTQMRLIHMNNKAGIGPRFILNETWTVNHDFPRWW